MRQALFGLLLATGFALAQTTSLTGSSSATITTSSQSTSGNSTTQSANFTTSFAVTGGSTFPVTVPVTTVNSASSAITVPPASSTITAEYPSLSGVSSCVTNCLQAAVSQVNCTSIINTSCYCTQQSFANQTTFCIANTCPDLLSQAESLAERFCNVSNPSTTLSFPSFETTYTPPATSTSDGLILMAKKSPLIVAFLTFAAVPALMLL